MLQKQLQSPELKVSTKNDSLVGSSQISNTCDIDPKYLLIAFRNDKRVFPSLNIYRISQCVSYKHLSTHYQNFVATINFARIPNPLKKHWNEKTRPNL